MYIFKLKKSVIITNGEQEEMKSNQEDRLFTYTKKIRNNIFRTIENFQDKTLKEANRKKVGHGKCSGISNSY